MAITVLFVVSVASMAESLTSELQNQLADIWKKVKFPHGIQATTHTVINNYRQP